MISWDNYEEYMMMFADNELSAAEAQELTAFMEQHPELKSEVDAYKRVHVSPDITMVYEEKATLLKPAAATKTISLPQWGKYAIAAGVAAILFVSVYKLKEPNNTASIVNAKNTATVTQETLKPEIVIAKKENVIPPPATVSHLIMKPNHGYTKAKELSKEDNPMLSHAATPETVDKLPLSDAKEIAFKDSAPTNLQIIDMTAYEAPAGNATAQLSIIDRLPIDDLKKQGLENIATSLSNVYEQVNLIKHQFQEKSLTIRIEKRKLILSF